MTPWTAAEEEDGQGPRRTREWMTAETPVVEGTHAVSNVTPTTRLWNCRTACHTQLTHGTHARHRVAGNPHSSHSNNNNSNKGEDSISMASKMEAGDENALGGHRARRKGRRIPRCRGQNESDCRTRKKSVVREGIVSLQHKQRPMLPTPTTTTLPWLVTEAGEGAREAEAEEEEGDVGEVDRVGEMTVASDQESNPLQHPPTLHNQSRVSVHEPCHSLQTHTYTHPLPQGPLHRTATPAFQAAVASAATFSRTRLRTQCQRCMMT